MARIRSIKPQFWRDDKIATLKNKLAGYFFIGLWSVADDEGKFKWNPKSIALELPIFRTKEVVTYLSELSQKGLIQKSECSQWGLITNWKHQKISKPQVPDVKIDEIQWVTESHSENGLERSRNIPRKDRIGKDRIGKDIKEYKEKNLKFDFESVYALYPKKEGKAKAFEVLSKTISNDRDFENLKLAVSNYAKKCKLEKTEYKFIKQFSTFIGPADKPFWIDFIDWQSNEEADRAARNAYVFGETDEVPA